MSNNGDTKEAKRRALLYLRKHEGEQRNEEVFANALPSGIDPLEIERRLLEEHSLVGNLEKWELTETGRLQADVLRSQKSYKRYLLAFVVVCVSAAVFIILQILL